MKAITCREYGPPDVLRAEEVDKPIPRDNEVLIKIRATTVTAADGMMRRGDSLMGRIILGLRKPRRRYRIMGLELAGEVEEIGRKVTRFQVGDRVFGFSGFSAGAYAQYSCMSEDSSLAIMPEALTFAQAAAVVDGPTTALYFLETRATMRKGDRILIIGASGSIGTSAVQLASYAGAEVTAVCSGANRELVRSLGAGRVIDYTREDFTRSGDDYDIIFDTVGKSSYVRCRASLRAGGCYLVTVGGLREYVLTAWTSVFGGKKCVYGMSIQKNSALQTVRRLVASGALRPVIDRQYTLDQIVEAHRYVDTGRKKGNVVVTVEH